MYWIRHKDHTDMFSQGYIGVSKDVQNRWKYHKRCKQNAHLTNAIALYGWNNLIKQIVIEAEIDYCLDIERKIRPSDKIGWNIVKGGGLPPSVPWNKGIPATEEVRKRLSEMGKGRPSPRKGVKLSEETKQKIRLAKLGLKQTPEHIEKCKIAKIGKKQSLVTCPHCNKIGGAWTMPRWHFDNCKNKRNSSWQV